MQDKRPQVEVAVCPPSVYLAPVVAAVEGTAVGVGAQNMYHEASGAFTGEISASMLVDIGCRYVILGHSERRIILGETSHDVNQKVCAALAADLTPIVCLGEQLAQRESGQTLQVIQQQFQETFAGLSAEQMQRIVIAYEPVWAIGTGKTATPEQAEAVHRSIRVALSQMAGEPTAARTRILYGGSVKPGNAAELFSQPNIDGGLIGGASLVANDFLAIVEAG